MRSIGVLIVRLVVGGLLLGHGAQKLFGAFGGNGLQGTAGWMESIQLRPGTLWARAAGGSEFFGGLFTMLGFLNPIGPILGMGSMAMAWAKVHLGKPVWVTEGGAELPLTNMAVLTALTLAGPGKLSMDGLFRIRLPRWIGATGLAAMFAALWWGAREELEQGAGTLAERSRQLVGVMDIPASQAAFEEDASRAETVGIDGSMAGVDGSMAGTAMGAGSTLGSETPDEF
jgi:putative oxidoreductase